LGNADDHPQTAYKENQNDIKSKTQRGRTPLQALAEQGSKEGFS
jgi:hypothetical protein